MVTQLKKASLQAFHAIRQRILSPTCSICHGNSDTERDLCTACYQALPWLGHTCQQCALPLASTTSTLCGQCLQRTPAFARTISLFHYQAPVAQMINQLKFQHRLSISRLFASLLAEKVQQHEQHLPELMLPIPLYKKRLQQRGFNQAQEITKHLSHQLNIPYATDKIKRVKNTVQQAQLPAKQRAGNVRNAFSASTINAQHVVIIDDVMTTGNTAQAVSEALHQQGVQQVDVWCIARPTLER